MSYTYPAPPGRCPHFGTCSRGLGCHAGSIPRGEWVIVVERDGRHLAKEWGGTPGFAAHRSPEGDEPPLDYLPLWVERERVLESLEGKGDALLGVVLEEAAASNVVGLRGLRDPLGLVVVVLGLDRAGTEAFRLRLLARLPEELRKRFRVVRAR